MVVQPDIVNQWREALIRKSASMFTEMKDEDEEYGTHDDVEHFVRAILDSYDRMMKNSQ